MHYLVTGAQGFLGAQVVGALRAGGAVVTVTGRRPVGDVVCCDLAVASDVVRMVNAIKPDRIVHCAAHVPRTLEEYQDESGAGASLDMLNILLAASSCPIVFISSMTVYGAERSRPTAEQDAGDPTSAYGLGKWRAEQRLMADGRPVLSVRIPGLFGPTRRNGLVYNVVHSAKHGHQPSLPSVPILWAAMHIDDAAASIAKLADLPISGFEAANVGYRGVYSIAEFVSIVAKIYGRDIDYSTKQPRFEFDLSKAVIHGAVPECSFEDALVEFGNQI